MLGKAEAVTLAAEGLDDWGMNVFRVVQAHEAWQSLGAWITEHKPQIGPGVKERFAWASTVDRGMLLAAASKREEIARRMERLLVGNAVLVLPTSPGIAPKIAVCIGIVVLRRNALIHQAITVLIHPVAQLLLPRVPVRV
jgi:amidase